MHYFIYMKLRQNGIVSFSIKLAVFLASGGAYMKLHVNITANRRILQRPTSFLSSDSLIEKTGKISTEKVQAVFES